MCFSTAILSYNIIWCSLHSMSYNDFLYDSPAYHRESIVGWRPCFFWRAFFSICFAWYYVLLSFGRSVFGSTTADLFNHVSRDWGDVTVVLVKLCWSLRNRLYIFLPQLQEYWNQFRDTVSIAIKTFSQSSKISVLFMSAMKSFDCSLNFLIFCVWLKSWKKDPSCWWFSNFSIDLLDLVFTCCILLFDFGIRYSS